MASLIPLPITALELGCRTGPWLARLSFTAHSALSNTINKEELSRSAVLADSRWAVNALLDRLHDPLLSHVVHGVAQQIVVAKRLGLSVSVAWVPAHASILGNEVADSIARLASRLTFTMWCGVFREDIMRLQGYNFDSWVQAV